MLVFALRYPCVLYTLFFLHVLAISLNQYTTPQPVIPSTSQTDTSTSTHLVVPWYIAAARPPEIKQRVIEQVNYRRRPPQRAAGRNSGGVRTTPETITLMSRIVAITRPFMCYLASIDPCGGLYRELAQLKVFHRIHAGALIESYSVFGRLCLCAPEKVWETVITFVVGRSIL